jgi:hypothetical protein
MEAVVYDGPQDVRVHDAPEPEIVDQRDAIIRITATDLRIRSSLVRRLHADDGSSGLTGLDRKRAVVRCGTACDAGGYPRRRVLWPAALLTHARHATVEHPCVILRRCPFLLCIPK